MGCGANDAMFRFSVPKRGILFRSVNFADKVYFWLILDFNIIYVIINFVKSNVKGELNWKLTKYRFGY